MMLIGKRLNEVEYYKDLDLFVKFLGAEKHVNDLLNGDIFMKNFKYFICLEKEEEKKKGKGKGDKLEASHVIRSKSLKIKDKKTNEIIAKAHSAELRERHTNVEKMPLFCVTHFHSEDFIITDIRDDIITIKLELVNEEIELFKKNFGDKAVILSNNFLDNMNSFAEKHRTRLMMKDVTYQDYNYYSSEREKKFLDGSLDVLFWKDEYFKYQREARFVLIDKYIEDRFILQMDSIISKSKLLSTEELFQNTELELPWIK